MDDVRVPNVTPGASSGFGDTELVPSDPVRPTTLAGPRRSERADVMPATDTGPASSYDPGEYGVEEVNTKLDSLDPDDPLREQIIAAERAGQNRVTIKGVRAD